MSNYFKTHTNCMLNRGFSRSLILDIQRQNFTLIPNSLTDIIDRLNKKESLLQIKSDYDYNDAQIIDEYLGFLLSNEFGIYIDYEEFNFFPDMNIKFNIPLQISNAIIEISNLNVFKLKEIIIGLEKLLCRNLQFISYEILGVELLNEILNTTKNCNFISIELILNYSDELMGFIKEMDKTNFKITNLIVHDSLNRNRTLKKTTFDIDFVDKKIKNFSHCGIVDKSLFLVNKEKVLESINHNSCLHKKMSIDKEGNIKNCPSMPQSFGNIKDTTLEEALNHPNFKKYWNVNKDMIAVCKDCEFRHICTDCRAYTERTHFDGEIDLSKPLKCGYNPYTSEWAEWSTNPLKEKAIEYYGMQDLVKKDA